MFNSLPDYDGEDMSFIDLIESSPNAVHATLSADNILRVWKVVAGKRYEWVKQLQSKPASHKEFQRIKDYAVGRVNSMIAYDSQRN